jgi:biotin synthase
MPTYLTMPLPSLRRQSGSQRHCAAVNTKEHTMTISPVALRRKTERKPHPTARYWKKCDVEALFGLPFLDLVYQAAEIHRQNFNPREIQLSTCCPSKPAAVPKTAPTARNRRTTTPIWAKSR